MYLRELLRFVFVYRLAYLLRCLVSFSFFVELPQIWRLLAVAWFRLAQVAGCLALISLLVSFSFCLGRQSLASVSFFVFVLFRFYLNDRFYTNLIEPFSI